MRHRAAAVAAWAAALRFGAVAQPPTSSPSQAPSAAPSASPAAPPVNGTTTVSLTLPTTTETATASATSTASATVTTTATVSASVSLSASASAVLPTATATASSPLYRCAPLRGEAVCQPAGLVVAPFAASDGVADAACLGACRPLVPGDAPDAVDSADDDDSSAIALYIVLGLLLLAILLVLLLWCLRSARRSRGQGDPPADPAAAAPLLPKEEQLPDPPEQPPPPPREQPAEPPEGMQRLTAVEQQLAQHDAELRELAEAVRLSPAASHLRDGRPTAPAPWPAPAPVWGPTPPPPCGHLPRLSALSTAAAGAGSGPWRAGDRCIAPDGQVVVLCEEYLGADPSFAGGWLAQREPAGTVLMLPGGALRRAPPAPPSLWGAYNSPVR
eukprot:TRINITY_DN72168_c0_g1_i1.p1 TRINITY_DN72168_c0_g1~~TRINITY_DN72168_c0_g1_i1.p1  ORF type:complete len:387 (+),score=77.97 TRINITY_DN72168_c0_g1_i1:74-1234(+)